MRSLAYAVVAGTLILGAGPGPANGQEAHLPAQVSEALPTPGRERDGSLELAIFGARGGPTGIVGMSAAWLPFSRLAVPFLLAWAWRSRATSEEVELLAGAGPAMLLTSFGASDSLMTAIGVDLELLASYVRPLTPSAALMVGLGLRTMSAEVVAGTSGGYLDGASGIHFQIPIHVGLRFRL
jgi:hypothetical protein